MLKQLEINSVFPEMWNAHFNFNFFFFGGGGNEPKKTKIKMKNGYALKSLMADEGYTHTNMFVF